MEHNAPQTPEHVRKRYDGIVDKLNTHWDLQLPRIDGRPDALVEKEDQVVLRCVARLRYLSCRSLGNLDRLLDDFEDYAKYLKSGWVFKPLQEAGTLPHNLKGRSKLFKDSLAKPLRLTSKQRKELLLHLDELVHEEFYLVRNSEVYANSTSGAPTKGLNQDSASPARTPHRPESNGFTTPVTSPERRTGERAVGGSVDSYSGPRNRKRSPSPGALRKSESPTKRHSTAKKQTLLPDSFRRGAKPNIAHGTRTKSYQSVPRVKDDSPDSAAPILLPSLLGSKGNPQVAHSPSARSSVITSFDSRASPEPTPVFTQPDRAAGTSSNETSFQSTNPHPSTQDSYPLTQGTSAILSDSFNSVTEQIEVAGPPILAFETSASSQSLPKALVNIPTTTYPSRLSFRCRYEISRVSQSSGIDPSDLIPGISSCADDYAKVWSTLSTSVQKHSATLPEKGSIEAWALATGNFQDATGKKSVTLSGKLEWAEQGQPTGLCLRLNPLRLVEGCRFHRKYGSDRFMTLTLPSLSNFVPKYQKQAQGSLRHDVATWLANTTLLIAGRTWRAYFVEPNKKKWKRRNRPVFDGEGEKEESGKVEDDTYGYRLHFFAVNGTDFSSNSHSTLPRPAVPLGEFLSWHIPVRDNSLWTDCKTFQRFALGLSQTIPSVVIQRSEFAKFGNIQNSAQGMVMNDGCARISRTLGRQIALVLGLESIPSVFQARIGGAKGLWMVEDDETLRALYPAQMEMRDVCVEIAASQVKILPHPEDDLRSDETQRTFEVVDYSTPPRVASLSIQLLSILADRGVPREVLRDLLLADNDVYYKSIFNAMDNRLLLRDWVGANKLSPRGPGEIRYQGTFPAEHDEQIILLLESGFTPSDCPMLHERLQAFLKWNLDRYIDKMQIRVPLSAFLFCIADPIGCLEPDQVHVGFSETWNDPDSGFCDSILDGLDVVVARLPAALPSDIQRRKAVWKKELRHYRDVIIFSTKGDIPLAHLLSGGDYDGDTPWLCWNPKIVSKFQNAYLPTALVPDKVDLPLDNKATPLSDIFLENGTKPTPPESEVNRFFLNCFEFNLNPSFLGLCTSEHEKVIYDEGSIWGPNAIKLATLAGCLVDSSKQGYLLTESSWEQIIKSVSPYKRQPPAYKNESFARRRKDTNIIDYLKFWVAEPAKEKTLALFHEKWPRKTIRETEKTLCAPWDAALANASEPLKEILRALKEDVEQAISEWTRRMPKSSETTDESVGNTYTQDIASMYKGFQAIQPRGGYYQWNRLWAAQDCEYLPSWRTVRASCLYNRSRGRKAPWYLAGDEICRLKVESMGATRTASQDMWKVYKPDKRILKRIVKREREKDDEIMEDE